MISGDVAARMSRPLVARLALFSSKFAPSASLSAAASHTLLVSSVQSRMAHRLSSTARPASTLACSSVFRSGRTGNSASEVAEAVAAFSSLACSTITAADSSVFRRLPCPFCVTKRFLSCTMSCCVREARRCSALRRRTSVVKSVGAARQSDRRRVSGSPTCL